MKQAAKRTVQLLSDDLHAKAALDAALLTSQPAAAGFDLWWRVELKEAQLAEGCSALEQPLHRCNYTADKPAKAACILPAYLRCTHATCAKTFAGRAPQPATCHSGVHLAQRQPDV